MAKQWIVGAAVVDLLLAALLAGCDTAPDQTPQVTFTEQGPWPAGVARTVSATIDPQDTRVTQVELEWGQRSTIDDPPLIQGSDEVWQGFGQFQEDVAYPFTAPKVIHGRVSGAETLDEGNVVDYRWRVTYQRPPDYDNDFVFTSFSESLVVGPVNGYNNVGIPSPGEVNLELGDNTSITVGQEVDIEIRLMPPASAPHRVEVIAQPAGKVEIIDTAGDPISFVRFDSANPQVETIRVRGVSPQYGDNGVQIRAKASGWVGASAEIQVQP